ncbi:hypothetical protein [Nostoc sp.]|uniref:hypothetical protein n=1 Tax=Nostoc sp. TaxID=1180 RepID=UPI002FF2B0DC
MFSTVEQAPGYDWSLFCVGWLDKETRKHRPPPTIITSRSARRTALLRLAFIIGNEPSGERLNIS